MKLKIRGLIFTGFAAAVFAQSASALQPAANLTDAEIDILKSTVTSKYYVDNNYQDLLQKEPTENGETTIDEDSDDAHYPTSKNVYEFVKDQVATLDSVANIKGDEEYTNVTTVNTGTEQNPVLVKQVELQQAPVTQNSGITGALDATTSKKLVTAGAVKSLIDTNAISTANSASATTVVPTSKAVYDYAQPKVATTNALQVGYYTGSGDAQWKTLRGSSANGVGSGVDYVTINEGQGGVYTVNLDDAQVGTHGTDWTDTNEQLQSSDINATSTKLTTGKAVYEYVRAYAGDTYQPKVDTVGDANNVQVGWLGSGANDTATWQTLDGVSYVIINQDDKNPDLKHIELRDYMIAGANTDLDDPTNSNDLVTVAALKASGAGATIPVECQASGVHCALVTSYTPADGANPARTEAKWTVMAQAQ